MMLKKLVEFVRRHGTLVASTTSEAGVIYGEELIPEKNTKDGKVLWRDAEFYKKVEKRARELGKYFHSYYEIEDEAYSRWFGY